MKNKISPKGFPDLSFHPDVRQYTSMPRQDVYKRQEQSAWRHCLSAEGRDGLCPVSYTHLDVYKRQFFNQPLRLFLPFLLIAIHIHCVRLYENICRIYAN